MHSLLRLALVALGLAAVVYSVASLTGGWLGTPPWWEREYSFDDFNAEMDHLAIAGDLPVAYWEEGKPVYDLPSYPYLPARNRELVSLGAVFAGVGLAAFGAWPRRRSVTAP